ncbi:SULT1 [Mytilus coruscus]|uniref:SULT1 n=1 Tax=Mytilus coruscus TaxID=42192 RepID=A0A6J7ZW96_MYTCO|nr:SULT1 [Mytilus coruscus]
MEKLKELRNTTKQIPLPEFEGVRFPAVIPIRKKGVEKALQDVREIQSRESDIMICTYPKSGPYGSWYNYEKEMEQAEKDFPGMIFTCYFEEMKKDDTGEIQRLANFLEIPCTEKTIANIAETTSFNNMQQNKLDITKVVSGKGFIYRKGEIGDWKNHFTVAQNERFDVQYTERFKGSSYKSFFEQIKET